MVYKGPTSLSFNSASFTSYGWRGSAPYNAADVPVPEGTGIDRTILEQRFAYEWYDQSSPNAARRNPPFSTRAAGQILPSLTEGGSPARILRGFIRRAEYDSTDYKSQARLYFMFNPENITRDYVSYLDQGALDPFNTVFQSGNLVPPPSFMDFTFSLLFDRQTEAIDPAHPGVFVDYEYFDLVVRNVVPVIDPNNNAANTLPDNGVMMVNPRDITVVFSPQITVQGRPSNARVTFQRFTHRMVPTRMQIDLTMRVTYFGPMKDMVAYPADEAVVASTVAWTAIQSPFTMTRSDIELGAQAFLEKMKANMLTKDQIQTYLKTLEDAGVVPKGTSDRLDTNISANAPINESVVDFALSKCSPPGPPKYASDAGNRHKLWDWADCSSFVWAAYADHDPPYNASMGPHMSTTFADGIARKGNIPTSYTIIDDFRSGAIPSTPVFTTTSTSISERRKVIEPACPLMLKGDVVGRRQGQTSDAHGHVAFVYSNDTAAKKIEVVDSASTNLVGKRTIEYQKLWEHYTDCFRPALGTPNSADSQNPPKPGG